MPDTCIVTTSHRYKPPPKKRKPVALIGAAIVTRTSPRRKLKPAAPSPANDDSPAKPEHAAAQPAIVTTISRKRGKLLRAEQRAKEEPDDAEADAAMRAWIERAKWGLGPAR